MTKRGDDAFVWAGGSTPSPPPSGHRLKAAAGTAAPAAGHPKGLLERSGGRVTRRMTMYLDPALARQVVLHAAETGREISDIAAEALEHYLAAQAAR
jgi:hypothetical protein